MSEPYPQPDPAQPQVPTGPPGGQTAIALNLRYHWSAFTLALLKPKVFVNGHELPQLPWGRSIIPVQPGQQNLHVYVPYFLPPKIGPADLPVDVAPGQVVEVEYGAPLWNFSKGSLGAPPQKFNGAPFLIGIVAAIVLIIICCCGLALLGS